MSKQQQPRASDHLVRALREDLTQHATELVTRLSALLRTAHVHDVNNEAWGVHLPVLREALQQLLRSESSASVEVAHGQVRVNGLALKPSLADVNVFRYLADQLAARRVRQLRFLRALDDDALQRLALVLADHPDDGTRPFAALAQALAEREVEGVALEEAGAEEVTQRPRTPQEQAAVLFLRGLEVVREAMEGLRAGRSVGFRRARRFVQDAVDLLARDKGLVLSLTTLKNCGEYLHNHSVNVCLLTLAVGQWLGMPKRELAELGVAALLRDVGKATVSTALRNKRGALTPEEQKEFERFPYAAVMGLLRFRGFSEATLRHILVAFEHPVKGTGGKTLTGREPSFFTKLIQLADAYDAMTTPRPYRKRPLLPYEALGTLVRERAQTGADPLLLRAFIQAVGLYPVGTVVLLDSGELGIVCEPPADARTLARPRVRLVSDGEGRPLERTRLTGTAAPDDPDSPLPRVVRLVDPWQHGLSVPHYLLGLPLPG